MLEDAMHNYAEYKVYLVNIIWIKCFAIWGENQIRCIPPTINQNSNVWSVLEIRMNSLWFLPPKSLPELVIHRWIKASIGLRIMTKSSFSV